MVSSPWGGVVASLEHARAVDERDRIPHLPARGRGAARAAGPAAERSLPYLPGSGGSRHRFRAGVARGRDRSRGDLHHLPAAAPERGGLLFLAARPACPPAPDPAARHRARARHHLRGRRHRPPGHRPAVGGGLRARGDPRADRPRGVRGDLPQARGARAGEHGRGGREPHQRRHGPRGLPGRQSRRGQRRVLGLGGQPGLPPGRWGRDNPRVRPRPDHPAAVGQAEGALDHDHLLGAGPLRRLHPRRGDPPRLGHPGRGHLRPLPGVESPEALPGSLHAHPGSLSFWDVLVFVLEALLFVLIGQQLPSILGNLEEYAFAEVLLYAALVYGAVVAARMAWFFTVPNLHPVFNRLLHNRYLRAPWQERLVMGWSGMRGGVSLAAALAVPLTIQGGAPFPRRDLILFLTFAVILATLVLQGLTLPPLIRALRLKGDENAGTLTELKARLEAAHAALGRLEQLCATGRQISPRSQEQMREYYEDRIRRYTAGLEAGGATEEYAESSAAWRDWRRELISAERDAIVSLRDGGEISLEVMRRIEHDLDLEESRIGG